MECNFRGQSGIGARPAPIGERCQSKNCANRDAEKKGATDDEAKCLGKRYQGESAKPKRRALRPLPLPAIFFSGPA
jgi:hypothetical protein